jgi:hypothetical protein
MEDLDRRSLIEAAMEQAEEGTLESPEEVEIEAAPEDNIADESAQEKARNEKGQFTKQEEQQASQEPEYEAGAQEEDTEESVTYKRPTTWKKEYKEIWDKMEKGEQIGRDDFVKFAEYANQRESEYQRGVSTYKAEADEAKSLKEAIIPFVPELQRQNINPATLINNLTRAHMILSTAPQHQKQQMIQRLAADYGVQFNPSGQVQQLDPYAQQLMNQLQTVNQEVSVIKNRFAQEENNRLIGEIESFKSGGNAPHFELVREEMAQLLELGKAQDLKTAYKLAVRINDEAWALEQEKLISGARQQSSKANQIAKAKAAAVSPRSVTPSGQSTNGSDKKDRRSLIAEQLNSGALSGRV